MQLSENSILFELTASFSKEMQFRLTQFGAPESAPFSDDAFCSAYRNGLESTIYAAKALQDLTSLIDYSIDRNAILWDSKNEKVLKRWFTNWHESAEKIREYLPGCIASRKFSDLVARFLRADEFVQGWLAKQLAYENGVLELDLPKKLPFGSPSESWYLESFERTF